MADPIITPTALRARLGRADAPLILDIRLEEDIALHPVRLPLAQMTTLADCEGTVPGEGPEVVVYCHAGRKLSQLGAGLLRSRGVDARALAGGLLSWLDAAGPVLGCAEPPATWLAPLDPSGRELACEWLLARVITNRARVLRMERDQAPPALKFMSASILPDDPDVMMAEFGVRNWTVPAMDTVPEALIRGRIRRGGDPLDLMDDLYAAEAA